MSRHQPPSQAKLIHLLIEERTKVLALERAHRPAECLIHDSDRDQARREIEAEVLRRRRER